MCLLHLRALATLFGLTLTLCLIMQEMAAPDLRDLNDLTTTNPSGGLPVVGHGILWSTTFVCGPAHLPINALSPVSQATPIL
jgi:hypothetical protein